MLLLMDMLLGIGIIAVGVGVVAIIVLVGALVATKF